MVRAGKILYIGISDAPAWIVSQANTIANLRGWTEFAGIQIEYSLIERTPERELLPMANALGYRSNCMVSFRGWSTHRQI